MKAAQIFFVTFLATISSISTVTYAQNITEAKAAAVRILENLENGKNEEVWSMDVSNWFKDKMTREAFLGNLAFIKAQLGGSSISRTLIQQNEAQGSPQHGYQGVVYSFMFNTKFPGAKVYESITLIHEDKKYKISGFYVIPNPNP